MKKLILFVAVSLLSTASLFAQTLNVKSGNVTYQFSADKAGLMPFSGVNNFSIQNFDFNVSEVSSMMVDNDEVIDNMVKVIYDNTTAKVYVAGNIAPYISVSLTGANVVIDQSADVNDSVGEITYRLSGTSEDGSFVLNGSYKASIELNGLTLTSMSGAPVDIQSGKRTAIRVVEGTVNTLVDAATGSQKGCISCKGHLEFKQKGTLNVTGNKSHGIYAKEYIEIKNTKINVLGSIKDGINCSQYFAMESGTLIISGNGDDGIQVSFKDDTNREAEDTGSFTLSGGTINVTSSADAAKAIKADGDVYIKKGTIVASTSGGGIWDADKLKTKASSCIGADGKVVIDGGSLTLKSSGGGGKGISCDGEFIVNDGEITIETTGGMCAYVSGKINQNYTGNADNLNSDYKSSPKGIKCDGNVTINGGSLKVNTTGKGSEGIESKNILTINGGTINIHAYDDGINSSSTMYINGGDIEVLSKNNDGIDSNADIYISGGVLRCFGASSPECGIDVNSPYAVYFTGGCILGLGGSNSAPSKTASTQAYVLSGAKPTAGSTVTIGTASETYYSFEIPSDYTSSAGGRAPELSPEFGPGGGQSSSNGLIISVPQLQSGTIYTIKYGTSSTTATARLTGGGSSF